MTRLTPAMIDPPQPPQTWLFFALTGLTIFAPVLSQLMLWIAR